MIQYYLIYSLAPIIAALATGSSSIWLCSPLTYPWHVGSSYLSPRFSPDSLVLEAKIWVLGVLIATGMSLLLYTYILMDTFCPSK